MPDHLILFVKNPVAGAVKTRLQTRLSPQQAARLYRAFILDTVAKLATLRVHARTICYAPADAGSDLRALCGDAWTYRAQHETDLGSRMHLAAQDAFEDGATRVVITGTDIPSLPAEHVSRAFGLLATQEVVLGPSTDGGYYLVGLRHPCQSLFRNIPWSTSTVFADTVARAQSAGLRLGLVPPWYDVDTPDELDFLHAHAAALAATDERHHLRHTLACLETL